MVPNLEVLMAVHNGEPYLKTAIESILNQTYRNFSFLIVDDASTDRTVDIIKSYSDSRIKLIELPANVGQTAALNVGLRMATASWIARMDADDYSATNRLEEQMNIVSEDPAVCCVGTFAWIFREDPGIAEGIMTKPESDAEIKRTLLREPPMIHGSLVFNRETVLSMGGYNDWYRVSADIDLYDRLLTPSHRAKNIPKRLLGIRRHAGQETQSLRAIDEGIEIFQKRLARKIYSKAERETIRSMLSFFYLLRVRYQFRNRQFDLDIIRDASLAFRTSPISFLKVIPSGLVDIAGRLFNDSDKTLHHDSKN